MSCCFLPQPSKPLPPSHLPTPPSDTSLKPSATLSSFPHAYYRHPLRQPTSCHQNPSPTSPMRHLFHNPATHPQPDPQPQRLPQPDVSSRTIRQPMSRQQGPPAP
ncbi:hypothetical protein ACLOJK_008048 [Asimina triloba]